MEYHEKHTRCDEPRRPLKVKAQVMVIDEATGLFKLIKGSALSTVSLIQKSPSDYFICAVRLCDQQELLRCRLHPDTVYHKANSTFHHWSQGSSPRHGLTFIHLKDADRFELVIRSAITDLQAKHGKSTDGANSGLPEDIPKRPYKPQGLSEPATKSTYVVVTKKPVSQKNGSKTSPSSKTSHKKPEMRHSADALLLLRGSPKESMVATRAVSIADINTMTVGNEKTVPTTSAAPTIPVREGKPPPAKPRNEYGDYRNDYYVERVSTSKAVEQEKPASDLTPYSESETKMLKNTPPLPRKKKRHRCSCFTACLT